MTDNMITGSGKQRSCAAIVYREVCKVELTCRRSSSSADSWKQQSRVNAPACPPISNAANLTCERHIVTQPMQISLGMCWASHTYKDNALHSQNADQLALVLGGEMQVRQTCTSRRGGSGRAAATATTATGGEPSSLQQLARLVHILHHDVICLPRGGGTCAETGKRRNPVAGFPSSM